MATPSALVPLLAGTGLLAEADRSGTAPTAAFLASRTVKDLLAGAGFVFADRGTHQLKGVPDSWQLYAVQLAER